MGRLSRESGRSSSSELGLSLSEELAGTTRRPWLRFTIVAFDVAVFAAGNGALLACPTCDGGAVRCAEGAPLNRETCGAATLGGTAGRGRSCVGIAALTACAEACAVLFDCRPGAGWLPLAPLAVRAWSLPPVALLLPMALLPTVALLPPNVPPLAVSRFVEARPTARQLAVDASLGGGAASGARLLLSPMTMSSAPSPRPLVCQSRCAPRLVVVAVGEHPWSAPSSVAVVSDGCVSSTRCSADRRSPWYAGGVSGIGGKGEPCSAGLFTCLVLRCPGPPTATARASCRLSGGLRACGLWTLCRAPC